MNLYGANAGFGEIVGTGDHLFFLQLKVYSIYGIVSKIAQIIQFWPF